MQHLLQHFSSYTLDHGSALNSKRFSAFLFQRRSKSARGHPTSDTPPSCHNIYTTCHQASPQCYSFLIWCPPDLVLVKPETTTVHVMGSFSDWLTLGLLANIWVPLPTKLPGNRSQHSCPLCGDIKMSSHGAYNHICLKHLGSCSNVVSVLGAVVLPT